MVKVQERIFRYLHLWLVDLSGTSALW